MSTNDKLTALADSIRKIAGVKQALKLDDMAYLLKPRSNMLTGSDDFSGNWNNVEWWKKESAWKGLTTYSSIYQWSGINQDIAIKQGKTYTFSLFARAVNKEDQNAQFYIPPSTDPSVSEPFVRVGMHISTDWARYAITFTAKKDSEINARLEPNEKGYILQVCGLKLEEGEMATPYVNKDGNIVIP